ncbi:hypothetical protein D3C81_1857880 [compost metagenome]
MRWAKRLCVVSQDVRCRADLEGELVPFYHERDDGYDTIDAYGSVRKNIAQRISLTRQF